MTNHPGSIQDSPKFRALAKIANVRKDFFLHTVFYRHLQACFLRLSFRTKNGGALLTPEFRPNSAKLKTPLFRRGCQVIKIKGENYK